MKSRLQSCRALSLVEVTIAIGLFAFCITAIIGLLPIGLNLVSDSAREADAVNIARAINGDVRNLPEGSTTTRRFDIPVSTPGEGRIYFTLGGDRIVQAEPNGPVPADAAFCARWQVRSRNGSTPPSVLITVFWPANSGANSGNPSGLVESVAVLSLTP